MADIEIPRLIYLLVLGTVILIWFLAQNKNSLGKTMQYAMVWGLIFVGAIAAVGLWGDISNDIMPRQSYIGDGQSVAVPRAPDGHYYLTIEINGKPVRFTVDTGATAIVLSPGDARAVGIDVDGLAFLGHAETANGIVRTARTQVSSFRLGEIIDDNITVYVNQSEMDGSLLGMAYLNLFSRIEIGDRQLTLTR